jgi:hypothetical protein
MAKSLYGVYTPSEASVRGIGSCPSLIARREVHELCICPESFSACAGESDWDPALGLISATKPVAGSEWKAESALTDSGEAWLFPPSDAAHVACAEVALTLTVREREGEEREREREKRARSRCGTPNSPAEHLPSNHTPFRLAGGPRARRMAARGLVHHAPVRHHQLAGGVPHHPPGDAARDQRAVGAGRGRHAGEAGGGQRPAHAGARLDGARAVLHGTG